jgi:hypothetical protein
MDNFSLLETKSRFDIGSSGTIGMRLYMKILWKVLVLPNHIQNFCQNIWMHVSSTNTINNMNKHTHDNITILVLLSIHASLIFKHDPIPNPLFHIYQMI